MKKTIMFLAIAAGLVLAVSTARLLAGGGAACTDTAKAGCTDAAKAGCCPMANKDCGTKVTVTGDMVCAKCKLHLTDQCQSVIQVEKDGQTVNYFLADNETAKASHGDICSGSSKKVTATGAVEEKDGKKILTACKIDPAA